MGCQFTLLNGDVHNVMQIGHIAHREDVRLRCSHGSIHDDPAVIYLHPGSITV